MRKVRVRITGSLDRPHQTATVTIDRDAGLFSVRPLRRRQEYVLPLSTVAEMVVYKLVKAEIANKRAERKRRRAGR